MKKFIIAGLVAIFSMHGICIEAKIVSPGFDECIKEAATSGQIIECLGNEDDYLMEKINKKLTVLSKKCEKSPTRLDCQAKLKSIRDSLNKSEAAIDDTNNYELKKTLSEKVETNQKTLQKLNALEKALK